jgi:steroid delta-isomerase-like uncharacterized protein
VPGAIIHSPEVGTTEGLKAFNRSFRTAFPDWTSTVEEIVSEGDRVAERWTGRGTHLGDFRGIPPTGRRVEVPGVVFYRMRDGKIAEFRGSFDGLRMLQQLGALPPAASAAKPVALADLGSKTPFPSSLGGGRDVR